MKKPLVNSSLLVTTILEGSNIHSDFLTAQLVGTPNPNTAQGPNVNNNHVKSKRSNNFN